jgi:hypothetical protein
MAPRWIGPKSRRGGDSSIPLKPEFDSVGVRACSSPPMKAREYNIAVRDSTKGEVYPLAAASAGGHAIAEDGTSETGYARASACPGLETGLPNYSELKLRFLEALAGLAATSTLKTTVGALHRLGVRRDTLIRWGIEAGYSERRLRRLVSRIWLCGGERLRRRGAGPCTLPEARAVLATVRREYGTERAEKLLRAALYLAAAERRETRKPAAAAVGPGGVERGRELSVDPIPDEDNPGVRSGENGGGVGPISIGDKQRFPESLFKPS